MLRRAGAQRRPGLSTQPASTDTPTPFFSSFGWIRHSPCAPRQAANAQRACGHARSPSPAAGLLPQEPACLRTGSGQAAGLGAGGRAGYRQAQLGAGSSAGCRQQDWVQAGTTGCRRQHWVQGAGRAGCRQQGWIQAAGRQDRAQVAGLGTGRQAGSRDGCRQDWVQAGGRAACRQEWVQAGKRQDWVQAVGLGAGCRQQCRVQAAGLGTGRQAAEMGVGRTRCRHQGWVQGWVQAAGLGASRQQSSIHLTPSHHHAHGPSPAGTPGRTARALQGSSAYPLLPHLTRALQQLRTSPGSHLLTARLVTARVMQRSAQRSDRIPSVACLQVLTLSPPLPVVQPIFPNLQSIHVIFTSQCGFDSCSL